MHARRNAPPRWFTTLRWFAAEFLIVVTGVLVALAVNAWWADRQDARREQTCLRQLAADLRETENLITQADAFYALNDWKNGQLLRAFHAANRPPEDSIVHWISRGLFYRPVAPVLATAEALVNSGHLGLIRNDSLRAAITRYVGAMETERRRRERWTKEWFAGANRVIDELDMAEIRKRTMPRALLDSLARSSPYAVVPEGPLVYPFGRFDAEAFLQNREAFLGLLRTANWKRNLDLSRAAMLDHTRLLQDQMDEALANRR